MNSLKQQIKSQHALAQIRHLCAVAGVAAISHAYFGLNTRRPTTKGFAALSCYGTWPRKHKRNRQTSKARARWMGLVRHFTPEAFHTGEYSLGI